MWTLVCLKMMNILPQKTIIAQKDYSRNSFIIWHYNAKPLYVTTQSHLHTESQMCALKFLLPFILYCNFSDSGFFWLCVVPW